MYDLANVKAWLNVTDAAHDAQITALMERALYAVQHELDWYFGTSRAVSEILDGTGNRALWLRQPPLDGVTVYSRSGVGAAWSLVAATEYELGGYGSANIITGRGLFNVGNWTRGLQNYRADYNEGFAVIPGDIEQLLLDIVSSTWNNRGSDPRLKSERIGDYSYTRGDLEESAYWGSVSGRWRRGRI